MMTGAEFEAIRVQKLGWSTQQTAATLGVNVRQVQRWESGKPDIPGPVQLLMRILPKLAGTSIGAFFNIPDKARKKASQRVAAKP